MDKLLWLDCLLIACSIQNKLFKGDSENVGMHQWKIRYNKMMQFESKGS